MPMIESVKVPSFLEISLEKERCQSGKVFSSTSNTRIELLAMVTMRKRRDWFSNARAEMGNGIVGRVQWC